MQRIAQIMYLKADSAAEYHKRHAALWPEMQQALVEHGAHNYSIFLNPATNELFAYLEVADVATYNTIAQTQICQKWWTHMAPLMKVNADKSPVTTDLTEVFHLNEGVN